MTQRHVGGRRPPEPADRSPSDREISIIEAASSIHSALPELHAAARMFFLFDPGFRVDLEEARQEWRGSTAPLTLDGLSEEQRFDIRVDVSNRPQLRVIAVRLATRWGLDLESTINGLAFDTAPTYPVGRVRYSCTDPETGYHYTEIRVESAYLWRHIQSALAELGWIEPARNLAWFWDRPAGSRLRLRGMDGRFAARTLALHFLTRSPAGRRPSGGTRLWREARELWESAVQGEMTSLDPDARTHWRRDRRHLLRFVIGRSADPLQLLMNAQQDLGLGDESWAARLGIDPDDWRQMRVEQPVKRVVWEQVKRAMPDVARAADAYCQVGLLKVAPDT